MCFLTQRGGSPAILPPDDWPFGGGSFGAKGMDDLLGTLQDRMNSESPSKEKKARHKTPFCLNLEAKVWREMDACSGVGSPALFEIQLYVCTSVRSFSRSSVGYSPSLTAGPVVVVETQLAAHSTRSSPSPPYNV